MTTGIETYLYSLSEDILILNVSGMHITPLPVWYYLGIKLHILQNILMHLCA